MGSCSFLCDSFFNCCLLCVAILLFSAMGDSAKVDAGKLPRYEPFFQYYLDPSEGTWAIISPILLTCDNYEA